MLAAGKALAAGLSSVGSGEGGQESDGKLHHDCGLLKSSLLLNNELDMDKTKKTGRGTD